MLKCLLDLSHRGVHVPRMKCQLHSRFFIVVESIGSNLPLHVSFGKGGISMCFGRKIAIYIRIFSRSDVLTSPLTPQEFFPVRS